MDRRPVLYLDIDDTLLRYENGQPAAAPGAHDFLEWATRRFEVRWLTRWCPTGEMEPDLAGDLCRMLGLDPDVIHRTRGGDWAFSGSKLDGILWLEHLVLGRAFIWVEDEYGVAPRARQILAEYGFESAYRHCNATTDPDALARIHHELLGEFGPAG